jgi:hypothetical protein
MQTTVRLIWLRYTRGLYHYEVSLTFSEGPVSVIFSENDISSRCPTQPSMASDSLRCEYLYDHLTVPFFIIASLV